MLLRSVWLLSLLLCGLMPGVASAQKELKLALDWAYQGNHAFFTLAEDNGHFAKEVSRSRLIADLARATPSPR